jgi:CRP-like cAMP-binding protein
MPFRSSKSSKIDLLKNVSLFSACTNKELGTIAGLVDEVDVEPGAKLTQEGKPGGEFFVVADGTAKGTLRGKKVASYGPGSFFGEMSLLDHGPRSATIVAESPMHLLVLDPVSFNELLNEAPGVARKILRTMAERLRSVERAPTH